MDILFLCHRLPYPPTRGDKIRSHAILSHLSQRHRVHLACFVDDPADLVHLDTVRALAAGECLFVRHSPSAKWSRGPTALIKGEPITTAYFGSSALSSWLKDRLCIGTIKRAVVYGSGMAPYLLGHPDFDPAFVLFDMVDVDSEKWHQLAAASLWPMSQIYLRESRKVLDLERRAASSFGVTTVVSDYEARCFERRAPEAAFRLAVIENGVDTSYFSPGQFPSPFSAGELPIVMTGRMDYRPNDDAVRWFASEISPLLAKILPRARFYAVGSGPSASLRALACDRLILTGEVTDVRPFLQHAAAVVAPLRFAYGIQNKILEAMAMERPVVATHAATRALHVTGGQELWIESDPPAFANALVKAAEGGERAVVAKNGRQYVERFHNWNRNLGKLDHLLTGLGSGSNGDIAGNASARSSWHQDLNLRLAGTGDGGRIPQ